MREICIFLRDILAITYWQHRNQPGEEDGSSSSTSKSYQRKQTVRYIELEFDPRFQLRGSSNGGNPPGGGGGGVKRMYVYIIDKKPLEHSLRM